MDKARDHQGMVSHEFPKEKQTSRPNSVMSNKSSNQDVSGASVESMHSLSKVSVVSL